MGVVSRVFMGRFESIYAITTPIGHIHFTYTDDEDVQKTVDNFNSGLISLDSWWGTLPEEDVRELIEVSHRFNLGDQKVETGESKMDLRGKCVRVDSFTFQELCKIQDRLEELGADLCETVVGDMYYAYNDGFYGVDHENDTMFFRDISNYSSGRIEGEELSAGEFLNLIGLVDMSEEDCSEAPLQGYAEPSSAKLYKVVANNGRTYYFDRREHLMEILKSDDKEEKRVELAVVIIDRNGDTLRKRYTPQYMLETKFSIEEL